MIKRTLNSANSIVEFEMDLESQPAVENMSRHNNMSKINTTYTVDCRVSSQVVGLTAAVASSGSKCWV
jgi:hypothetical protein